MKHATRIARWGLLAGLLVGGGLAYTGPAQADEQPVREWSGGAAMGFLGNSPDGTAFALNLNADRFLSRHFSMGPLMQLGVTGDLTQVGLSGQGKYWIDIPDTADKLKLVLQGGLGFVHADMRRTDTSWLIPLGVGLDYKVDERMALTSTFLLNFTDLDPRPGARTTVMPGLTVGVRF